MTLNDNDSEFVNKNRILIPSFSTIAYIDRDIRNKIYDQIIEIEQRNKGINHSETFQIQVKVRNNF